MVSKIKQKREKGAKGLQEVNPYAAGADLGARFHYVSISQDLVEPGESWQRVFATHTEGLRQLCSWLVAHGIQTIAMEATGVYWMGAFEQLEDAGIEVCLVNARHLKNVSGRKSDALDSEWIQQLHSYGLLRPSFVPQQAIRDLRSYIRQRSNVEGEKSRSILHIHKALDLMNIKVHHLLRDMEGQTGMKILRAIDSGECRPEVLCQFHSRRLKASQEELLASLQGNYKAAHIFVLTQALQRYDMAVKQMQDCDVEIEKALALMMQDLAVGSSSQQVPKPGKRKSRKNAYGFDVHSYLYQLTGVDLTAIDGLSEATVLEIISEVGIDLKSHFATAQHFTSWLRLAPQVKISGGKVLGHYRPKGANRANKAFRLAAYGLANSKSALGAYYRRLRARKGPKVANKATARKIAVIFYLMITTKQAYRHHTQAEYEARYQQQRLKRLRKQAKQLGFELQKVA